MNEIVTQKKKEKKWPLDETADKGSTLLCSSAWDASLIKEDTTWYGHIGAAVRVEMLQDQGNGQGGPVSTLFNNNSGTTAGKQGGISIRNTS